MCFKLICRGCQGSSVIVVTRLQAGRLGFDSQQKIFLYHHVQTSSGIHSSSYAMGNGVSFHMD